MKYLNDVMLVPERVRQLVHWAPVGGVVAGDDDLVGDVERGGGEVGVGVWRVGQVGHLEQADAGEAVLGRGVVGHVEAVGAAGQWTAAEAPNYVGGAILMNTDLIASHKHLQNAMNSEPLAQALKKCLGQTSKWAQAFTYLVFVPVF